MVNQSQAKIGKPKQAKNTENKRGLFVVTDRYLYFANDGTPFDRDGVMALNTTDLTSKSGEIKNKPIDSFRNIEDKHWLDKQREQALDSYIKRPNLIIRERNAETGGQKDYAGRWIYELLQNMDDAIGEKDYSKFIGTKGLGFLSILEITDFPEIFSGPFNFKFSKKLTTGILKKVLTKNDNVPLEVLENPPTFGLPHPATPDQTVEKLKKKGFITVFKALIKSGKKIQVVNELKSIEPYFLLFAQNIKHLEIIINEKTVKSYYISTVPVLTENKNTSVDRITITTGKEKNKEDSEEWMRWKRIWNSEAQMGKQSSCMFCLPIEDNLCQPHKTDKTTVYNFYPTFS